MDRPLAQGSRFGGKEARQAKGQRSSVDHESWIFPAHLDAARKARRAVAQFCEGAQLNATTLSDMKLAVTEAVTNVVMHAYVDRPPGSVTVVASLDQEHVVLEVRDRGGGMAPRVDSPGLGMGLPLIGSVADELDISAGPAGDGTAVRMLFRRRRSES